MSESTSTPGDQELPFIPPLRKETVKEAVREVLAEARTVPVVTTEVPAPIVPATEIPAA